MTNDEWLIAYVRFCDEFYSGHNTKRVLICVATNGSRCQAYQNHNSKFKSENDHRESGTNHRAIKYTKRGVYVHLTVSFRKYSQAVGIAIIDIGVQSILLYNSGN